MKQTIVGLGRQILLQQMYVEERIRSDGHSGIKTTLRSNKGTRSYSSQTFTGDSVAGFYDQSHTDNALGIGYNEFVMNGLEVKLQGTKYHMRMPSRNSKTWHAVEDIPFPDVPPSVRNKNNVTEQIHEMYEYFKAWTHQDKKIRSDFEEYFRPVLCYLEGYWLKNTWGSIDGKMRDLITKRKLEYMTNLQVSAIQHYHPVNIMQYNTTPKFGHFETRILCHPVKTNLQLKQFYPVDDVATRLRFKQTYNDYTRSNKARFRTESWNFKFYDFTGGYSKSNPHPHAETDILDDMMNEIPGLDNYPAELYDNSFNSTVYNVKFTNNFTRMNTGYYNRRFKVGQKGAMGTVSNDKGFSDQHLWTAQTSHTDKVAGCNSVDCKNNPATHKRDLCFTSNTRVSYAIPLEIVWMTPLLTWNPYNVSYTKGVSHVTTANHRNGVNELSAFNGTDSEHFFITPAEFYTNNNWYIRHVLDKHGKPRRMSGSGIRTRTEDIQGIGQVRLRYPIVPAHIEGYAVYKEIDALKKLLNEMSSYQNMYEKPIPGVQSTAGCIRENAIYAMKYAYKFPPGAHKHDIYLSPEKYDMLVNNHANTLNITVMTTINNNHQHQLTIRRYDNDNLFLILCDGHAHCWDGHGVKAQIKVRPKDCPH